MRSTPVTNKHLNKYENDSSQWLGTLSYREGLLAQEQAISEVSTQTEQWRVLGLEHSPVLTAGKRVKDFDQVKALSNGLADYDFEFTPRGGLLTLHMPGQLVIYPILNLNSLSINIRELVQILISTTQKTLLDIGVETTERHTSALYTDIGKIAFFGLRVERGISSHGLAINVSNAIGDFKKIPSCGITNDHFDRTSNHKSDLTPQSLFTEWMKNFQSALSTSK